MNECLAHDNKIIVLTGAFPGARNESINGLNYVRIGSKSSYLVSRVTFALLIPLVIRRYQSDIVVNDCSYFAPSFADLLTKRPVINIIHHLMGGHSFRIYNILGIVPFIVEKILLNISKCILTESKGVKDDILSRYPDKTIRNIPIGFSQTLLDLKPAEGDFILFLGRIDIYMKGLDILINSFSRIKNQKVRLKIAGSGKKEDVKRLEKMINDYGLGAKVKTLGRVSEQDKSELLRSCLFLVMPSRFEGWGIAAVEANAASKPVLGMNIEGLSEAVVHNKTAILVEPGNRQEFVSTMDRLIKDEDLRAKLGKEGRRHAKKISWEYVSKLQFDFYKEVLKNSAF